MIIFAYISINSEINSFGSEIFSKITPKGARPCNIQCTGSFSFFMDSPLDVAVCRRCIRDIQEYDVTAEYSLIQFLKFVRPAYFEYILPAKKHSDLIVENNFQTRLDLFIDDFLLINQL